MWQQLYTIATQEIRVIMREKTFLFLLIIFVLMTLFSTYIGWSTKTTVLNVYHVSLTALRHAGISHLPPNPFSNIPALAIFNNMIVYVFLIGALLAIVVGHRSFIRERKSGVVLLLFSKPVQRKIYIAGKILGIFLSLLLILSITCLVSLFSSVLIPGLGLSFSEITRLFVFYGISLLYLLIFAMLGLLFAIALPNESLALFAPIIIWVAITFIFPELTTGQNPVALLNPTNISQTAPEGTFFTTMQTVLSPISIEQQYTAISQPLLETKQELKSMSISEVFLQNMSSFLSLIFYTLIALLGSVYALSRYSASKDKMYE